MKKIIYLDMDGVLADFETRIQTVKCDNGWEHLCFRYPYTPEAKQLLPEFWHAVKSHPDFFISLPLMPHAQLLWDYCKQHADDLFVLTSIPRGYDTEEKNRIAAQKLLWIQQNLDPLFQEDHFIGLFEHHEKKADYVVPSSPDQQILIDDLPRYLDPWIKAGGTGILYNDHHTAMEELKKIF